MASNSLKCWTHTTRLNSTNIHLQPVRNHLQIWFLPNFPVIQDYESLTVVLHILICNFGTGSSTLTITVSITLGADPCWIIARIADSDTKVVAVVTPLGLTNSRTVRAVGTVGAFRSDSIAQHDQCVSVYSTDMNGFTKLVSNGEVSWEWNFESVH